MEGGGGGVHAVVDSGRGGGGVHAVVDSERGGVHAVVDSWGGGVAHLEPLAKQRQGLSETSHLTLLDNIATADVEGWVIFKTCISSSC